MTTQRLAVTQRAYDQVLDTLPFDSWLNLSTDAYFDEGSVSYFCSRFKSSILSDSLKRAYTLWVVNVASRFLGELV